MASSKLSEDRRVVVVTSPGVLCEVGDTFAVIADAASYGVDYSDWILRIVAPPSMRRYTDGDSTAAVERIREALTTGVVHGSLLRQGERAPKYA